MGIYDIRPCSCGSEKVSHWEFDARGIPLTRVCSDCRDQKLAKYRPEVLSDSDYAANEDIEPDYDSGEDYWDRREDYWDHADRFGDE